MLSAIIDKLYLYFIAGAPLLASSFGWFLLTATCVLLIETVSVGWDRGSLRRLLVVHSRSARTDLALFLLIGTGVGIAAQGALSLGIVFFFGMWVKQTFNFSIMAQWGPYLHLAIFLVVIDLINYWQHRLMHSVPFLWEIHKFHHSASEFNMITVWRDHPIERAMNQAIVAIPIASLGFPGHAALVTIFLTAYGMLKHGSLRWQWGWFGRYILQSPMDHWIHHSPLPEHFNRNFANNLSIFDHCFGTYYNGKVANAYIGIVGDDLNDHGFLRNIFICQWRSCLELLRGLRILPCAEFQRPHRRISVHARASLMSWLCGQRDLEPNKGKFIQEERSKACIEPERTPQKP